MSKFKDTTWLLLGRFIGLSSPLFVTPYVARALTKEEIGTWALIQVVVGFVAIFQDGGLSPYVIRHKNYEQATRSMVSSCGGLLGVAVGLILLVGSIPVCRLLGISEQWKLFLPLTIVYGLGGLASVWNAELRRNGSFKQLFLAGSIPQLLSVPFSVLLLANGFGLWTFPLAALFGAITQVLFLIPFCRPIRFAWSQALLPEMAQYTRGLLGFSLINYWARRLDDLLIGRYLGTAPLAIYSNAYRLMLLPISQVISLFNPLILPYMSKHQDDLEACRTELYGFLSTIGLIVFAGMSFLWIERNQLINWYLGNGWNEVSDILFWFAPLGMLQCLINPLGNCYMISSRNDRFFWIGVINTAVVICGFIAGLKFGVKGVALGYFIANLIMIYPNVRLSISTIGGSFREWLFNTSILWVIPIGGIIFSQFNTLANPYLSVAISAIFVGLITLSVAVIIFRSKIPTVCQFLRLRRKKTLS
ncbi:oligosaccharide flippase family protein [Luteolibacter pohnpeiensis]|uniref:Oligosaccharide flippase family protein n=1 Tax=Luteolibacter pohnpeiensis TaxID=454153 RepID=A0A934S5Y8_9BACT|nr:oligosaccharide flippase family protein [Luteolibacter pohnpeiensis]MBK1882478.1 oligosaccharide flippase family protein [Luteolibacter pohnpeiensis]